LDRDSETVAHLFDERNAAVERMIALAIEAAHRAGKKIGICGQAPSDYPEFARFLVERGITSISLNPDTVIETTQTILEAEASVRDEWKVPTPFKSRARDGGDAGKPVEAVALDPAGGATAETGAAQPPPRARPSVKFNVDALADRCIIRAPRIRNIKGNLTTPVTAGKPHGKPRRPSVNSSPSQKAAPAQARRPPANPKLTASRVLGVRLTQGVSSHV
jgi:hypothetical protein